MDACSHSGPGQSGEGQVPAVCFQGVGFAYGRSPVLRDADFDVFPGESVCIVGPNGGGKTTLLKLILGLVEAESGTVSVLGGSPRRMRGRIGYVPQRIEFDPSFPATALDVVLTGLLTGRTLGFARPADKRRARDTLDRLGLADHAGAAFASLSGGQRQTVLIARALVGDPELLLLDEPAAHVDVAAEERLYALLRSLREEVTLLTVSHDLAFVSRAVPKVICVNRDVHVHPTVELTKERLRELYGYEVAMVHHGHEHLDSHGGHHHA